MKIVLIMLAFFVLIFSGMSMAKSYRGGHYYSDHGSSHKGGYYVNPRTRNYYTKRH